jgi:CDP-6-deoxy-D-xylo-4-hexulose-3-dehydrase
MGSHPQLLIQQETGCSSWFGFSLILRPDSGLTRRQLLDRLVEAGFECRPIVAGNFAKNPVVRYFDHEVPSRLTNADWLDANGLFVGNHHYPINDAIDVIVDLRL